MPDVRPIKTRPIDEYYSYLVQPAVALFDHVRQLVPAIDSPKHAEQPVGSWSIMNAQMDAVIAKIVIRQGDKGSTDKKHPPLRDGVYVLIRSNGPAGERIAEANLESGRFSQFFRQMSMMGPVSVQPHPAEHFACFRLDLPKDEQYTADYLEQVAELIEACHRVQ